MAESRSQAMRDPTAFVSQEQVAQAIEREPDMRNKLIIRILFRGGMRVSEMTGTEVKNILWNENCLLIPWLKRRHKEGEAPLMRKIPIDSGTMIQIKEYLDYRAKFHTYRNGSSKLIPLDRRMVYVIVRRAFERIGIMYVGSSEKLHHPHPHTLRHSYATVRVAKTGGDYAKLRQVQRDMGHDNINTTASYLDVLPGVLHEEYDNVFEEGS